jgi:Peptidase propeptide and YPEB domain
MRAVHLLPRMAARIAFHAQTFRIARHMTRSSILTALVLLGLAPLTQAHSLPGPRGPGGAAMEQPVAAAVARDGISLDEAVARAERQYRARVVRTDVQDEDGRKVYVLKLLSEDGRVFTVRVDAQSGRAR